MIYVSSYPTQFCHAFRERTCFIYQLGSESRAYVVLLLLHITLYIPQLTSCARTSGSAGADTTFPGVLDAPQPMSLGGLDPSPGEQYGVLDYSQGWLVSSISNRYITCQFVTVIRGLVVSSPRETKV